MIKGNLGYFTTKKNSKSIKDFQKNTHKVYKRNKKKKIILAIFSAIIIIISFFPNNGHKVYQPCFESNKYIRGR